jgi:acetyl-CoA carboxylase biotin carboxyl carrier protein
MPEDKSQSAIDLLKQVCDIMESRDLTEVYVREGEISLRVRRGGASMPASAPPTHTSGPPSPTELPESSGVQLHGGTGELVKAPMPGMFYRASSPEESPFVEVGDVVSEEDTLCLIEAMKIFNEVKPDFPCEIVEILVENAAAIEFDQPLFRVRKR